jgi:hypothetical protein
LKLSICHPKQAIPAGQKLSTRPKNRKARFSARRQYCFFLIFIKPLYHTANLLWDIFLDLFSPFFHAVAKIHRAQTLDSFFPQAS